jgi:DNA-binding transcriptional MerR regulator
MSSIPEGLPSPTQTPGARSTATLARNLADFLVEFSIVLHKRAMYPLGHPHLQESTERFVNRLESLLSPRDTLAIGIARHQLIVAGVATDPRNALLSDLARRLHRHRIATLRFDRGISLQEIDDLLAALAADPQGDDGPFGLRPAAGSAWTHLKVQPPELNRLFLQEEEDDDAPETPGGALWLGLAHLALSADGSPTDTAEDPLVVARAIDAQPEQVGYDRVVLDYLGQMADEMSGRQGAWEPRVRERVSRLVTSLKPETLRRVLEAGADHSERRRFALTASEVLAVDAVIEVVEAAAATTGQTISHQLLRLLNKFAHHAEQGPERGRAEAESMQRRNVAQLITDWNLEDPNPREYTAVLDGMVRQAPDDAGVMEEDRLDCEPALVLQIALETDCGGPRVYAALDTLVGAHRIPEAVGVLCDAPPAGTATANALWRHIATPARLRAELSAPRLDFATIESLVSRLGALAVDPLLDVLEQANDRSARAHMLRLLVSIGPPVAPVAAARLKNAPWFVQRNLLALLRMLKIWPAGFSAVTYARHPDLRLRREAYKLLLEFPEHRASAVTHGLGDENTEIVTLVLRAAVDDCPPEARRAVERFMADSRRPAELRAIAVRALGRANEPHALALLLDLAGTRRHFFGWRIEAKSPVVLAAVSVLARNWGGHPQVIGLLREARDHDDPEIRMAAKVRFA